MLRRSVIGLVPYAIATLLAFVSPYITLIISGAVAAYYAHPAASGMQSSGVASAVVADDLRQRRTRARRPARS